jgi:hypothetical protein
MAKKEEVVVKKTTKVTLETRTWGSSTIYRGAGLPAITDRTEKAVEWLKAQGYKPAEIELIGEKPANWDAVFDENPVAPIAEPVSGSGIMDDSVPSLADSANAAEVLDTVVEPVASGV